MKQKTINGKDKIINQALLDIVTAFNDFRLNIKQTILETVANNLIKILSGRIKIYNMIVKVSNGNYYDRSDKLVIVTRTEIDGQLIAEARFDIPTKDMLTILQEENNRRNR